MDYRLEVRSSFDPSATSLLVVFECRQKEGMDYFDTFAGSLNTASIHSRVSITVKEGMALKHFDTEQAIVRSDIDAGMCLGFPPGCGPLSQKAINLNKALRDLR